MCRVVIRRIVSQIWSTSWAFGVYKTYPIFSHLLSLGFFSCHFSPWIQFGSHFSPWFFQPIMMYLRLISSPSFRVRNLRESSAEIGIQGTGLPQVSLRWCIHHVTNLKTLDSFVLQERNSRSNRWVFIFGFCFGQVFFWGEISWQVSEDCNLKMCLEVRSL